MVRIHLPAEETQETACPFLVRKILLEEEMVTLSSVLAWNIACAEEPGRLQFIVLQRVKHD